MSKHSESKSNTDVNLYYMKKCCSRYHLATLAIAEKILNIPYEHIKICPYVLRGPDKALIIYPSSSIKMASGDDRGEFIHSFVMNASFALELKLKYLHTLESGEISKKTHNLGLLYASLTGDTKEFLRNELIGITKGSEKHKELRNVFQKIHKIKGFKYDPFWLLEQSNVAFETWRYAYQDSYKIVGFAGYSELQQCLDRRIELLEEKGA